MSRVGEEGDGPTLDQLREARLAREQGEDVGKAAQAFGGSGRAPAGSTPTQRAIVLVQCAVRLWLAKKRYVDLLFEKVQREEEEMRRHQLEQCEAGEVLMRRKQLERRRSDDNMLQQHQRQVVAVAAHRIQWAFRRRRQLRAIVRIQSMFRRQRKRLRARAAAAASGTAAPSAPGPALVPSPAAADKESTATAQGCRESKRGAPGRAGSFREAAPASVDEAKNMVGAMEAEAMAHWPDGALRTALEATLARQTELSDRMVAALKRRDELEEEKELVAVGIRQSVDAMTAAGAGPGKRRRGETRGASAVWTGPPKAPPRPWQRASTSPRQRSTAPAAGQAPALAQRGRGGRAARGRSGVRGATAGGRGHGRGRGGGRGGSRGGSGTGDRGRSWAVPRFPSVSPPTLRTQRAQKAEETRRQAVEAAQRKVQQRFFETL